MKIAVFLLGLCGTITNLIFQNAEEIGLCGHRGNICESAVNRSEDSLYIFFLVVFFSIVTYKMQSKIFSAWWAFASITVPVILFISFLVNLGYFHGDGGFLNMNDTVDLVLLVSMYFFFVTGSIIQIIRGYRQK
jgi:hypothetical protein